MENKIRVGQFFKNKDGEIYILSGVEKQRASLIALTEVITVTTAFRITGVPWVPSKFVEDLEDISKSEWESITSKEPFQLIDVYISEVPPEKEMDNVVPLIDMQEFEREMNENISG